MGKREVERKNESTGNPEGKNPVLLPGAHAWWGPGKEHEETKPTREVRGIGIWHLGGGTREGLLREMSSELSHKRASTQKPRGEGIQVWMEKPGS